MISDYSMKGRNDLQGFTLLEVMIALFIFVIVASISIAGLRQVLSTTGHLDEKTQSLTELQWAMTLLSTDLQQTIARSILDEEKRNVPAFLSHLNEWEWTRGGIENPSGIFKRSTLERVVYEYRENSLIRRSFPVLDRMPGTHALSRTVLQGVKTMSVRFIDDKGIFFDHWPVIDDLNVLPRAVEITFSLEKWGNITRVIYIPGQAVPSEH